MITAALRARVTIAQRLGRADDDRKVKALIVAGGLLLAALARRLAAGEITREQFLAQATALLQQRAQTAAAHGGGPLPPATVADLIDDRALDGYATAIQSGAASAAETAARAALWLGVAWAAYQTARVASAPQDASWAWVCKEDKASCDGCAANAAGGPYTRATLPGRPADGSTPCLGNCRCRLDRLT